MIIDLKKYFMAENLTDTIVHTFTVAQEIANGTGLSAAPVTAQADLKGKDGFVELKLSLSFQMETPCDRCLETAVLTENAVFEHILVREQQEDDKEDVYLCVENDSFDLEALACDDILLSLPTRILCAEDCKGLCPKCGVNRNKTACGCETKMMDARLEVLKQLLDN